MADKCFFQIIGAGILLECERTENPQITSHFFLLQNSSFIIAGSYRKSRENCSFYKAVISYQLSVIRKEEYRTYNSGFGHAGYQ
jgi:hypothetical protein